MPQVSVDAPSSCTLTEEKRLEPSNTSDGHSLGVTHSGRNIRLPIRFNDYVVEGKHGYGIERSMNYSVLTNENKSFVSNLNKTCDPNTYLEASLDPNWVKAMNDEIGALYRNHTRDIVDLPKNRKHIGCRWIYEIKYISNGEIKRYIGHTCYKRL